MRPATARAAWIRSGSVGQCRADIGERDHQRHGFARRHRGIGRHHPALPSASRAGVPLLHWHPRVERSRSNGLSVQDQTESVFTIHRNAQLRVDSALADPAGDEPHALLRRALVHVVQITVRSETPNLANFFRHGITQRAAHQLLLRMVSDRQYDEVSGNRLTIHVPALGVRRRAAYWRTLLICRSRATGPQRPSHASTPARW